MDILDFMQKSGSPIEFKKFKNGEVYLTITETPRLENKYGDPIYGKVTQIELSKEDLENLSNTFLKVSKTARTRQKIEESKNTI